MADYGISKIFQLEQLEQVSWQQEKALVPMQQWMQQEKQQLVLQHQLPSIGTIHSKFLDAPQFAGGPVTKKIFRLAQVEYRS